MHIKMIVDEDIINYKKPSMMIGTVVCTWKCCDDACIPHSTCQNYGWNIAPIYNIPNEDIIERYMNNVYTDAIIFAGLEPFDQFDELITFIDKFREVSNDDVVIYTGYNKNEICDQVKQLSRYKNIIVKFGRYIPDQESTFDELLGVKLASPNQHAEYISLL